MEEGDRPKLIARRDALLQMAVWQDSLLQSYRSINVTLQSVLLIVLGVLLDFPGKDSSDLLVFVSLCIAALVFLLALFSNDNLQKVINARGRDVSYVHREICLSERYLPREDRLFTRFKIEQSANANLINEQKARFLSDNHASEADIETLIDGRLGFARRVIDRNLFNGMQVAAFILFGIKAILVGFS